MLPHQAALRPTGRRQEVAGLEVHDAGAGDRGEVGLVTSGTGSRRVLRKVTGGVLLSPGWWLRYQPSWSLHCTVH